MAEHNITKNTKEYNEFSWDKLTAGKLQCLYGLLANLDTGENPLIHDMRCELRNFFYGYDQRIYSHIESMSNLPKS